MTVNKNENNADEDGGQSRSVTLTLHVGPGKTGTTFVQSVLSDLSDPDVFYFGKNLPDGTDIPFDPSISKIHYQLFIGFRAEVISGYASPSRSSTSYLNAYAEAIVSKIRSSEASHFVISDECIFDYINTAGEWNSMMAIALGNQVATILGRQFVVHKRLVFTIRRQGDLLSSFYAYTPTLSFQRFANAIGSREPEQDPITSGMFFGSNIELLSLLIDATWSIVVIPSEILFIENNAELYLCSILGKQITVVDNQRQNSNSVFDEAGEKLFTIRPRNFLMTFGFRKCHESLMIFRSRKKLGHSKIFLTMHKVSWIFGHCILLTGLLISRFQKFEKTRETSLSKTLKAKLYDDNKKLAKFVDIASLEKFGYLKPQ